jgi:hypothetical protein
MTHYHRIARVMAAVAACLAILGHSPLAAGQNQHPGLDG